MELLTLEKYIFIWNGMLEDSVKKIMWERGKFINYVTQKFKFYNKNLQNFN
jgi:hypothetical protein